MFCVETAGIFVLLLSEFSVAFCLRGGIKTKTAVSRKYVSALSSTLLTLLLPTDLMKMWLFFWINLMIEFPVGSQRRQQRPESVCLSQSSGLLWGKSFRTSHLCKCIKFLWLQFYVQLNSSNKHHSAPSQLHMAASCTVTSIKHWRPCSTGPYCPWECVLLVMAAREFRYSPLITLSRVRKGLFFPVRNDGDYGVCPNRRNASSWAEPSDGGGASVDHPWRFHRPQNGGWEHGEQHPGFRQRAGSILRSTEPICYLVIPA